MIIALTITGGGILLVGVIGVYLYIRKKGIVGSYIEESKAITEVASWQNNSNDNKISILEYEYDQEYEINSSPDSTKSAPLLISNIGNSINRGEYEINIVDVSKKKIEIIMTYDYKVLNHIISYNELRSGKTVYLYNITYTNGHVSRNSRFLVVFHKGKLFENPYISVGYEFKIGLNEWSNIIEKRILRKRVTYCD